MKNKKKRKLLQVLLLGIVFLCLLQLGQVYFQSANQKEQQEELRQIKQTVEETATKQEKTVAKQEESATKQGQTDTANQQEMDYQKEQNKEEAEPVILEKYEELYEENQDMAGWITVEGTNIDYPVMQCSDNEYYLHHDFYGEESQYGCLYVKEEANLTNGTNFIIYGHNMKDGSMFGNLDCYLTEDFYREHSMISFDTLYEERTYEILAVFRSQVYNKGDDVFKYYQFYQADMKEEFDDFYSNIKNLSLYDTGVEAKFGDVFLTLSTCSYHVEDGRLVVVAKRIE